MSGPLVTITDWLRLVERSGLDGGPVRAAGAALLAAYGEAGRHYHDQRHLTSVLGVIDGLGGDLVSRRRGLDLVRFAAWYHDAVHRPAGSGDDEERSASLARAGLGRLGMTASGADEVARLVLLTRTHRPMVDDRAGALLCDADLWILGSEPEVYDRYANAVRTEYAHVDDAAWRSGRAAVLSDLLGRASLFHTERGRERERPARHNLARELSRLAR